MVSPSLSATLVAIATILNCSDGFVTSKSPSINIGSTTAGSNTLPQSCNNIVSSTPKLCLLTPPPTTTTSLYSTQQQATTTDDGETPLQSVFSTYSDDNNLMSKDQLKRIPSISEMLAEGDLLPSELDDMWDAVVSNKSDNKIDVDGFVQVYKDIDDLFEEEEEEVDDATLAAVSAALAAASGADETELAQAFDTLKDGGDGISSNTISFSQLRQWEEITSLVSEGMLGEDEFKSLWESSGDDGDDNMDLERFLKFNNALDDLFVFDEDEEVDEEVDEISSDM
eukprot:scaffold22483_cov80-Skeletonema_marinoi.AAC.1